MASAHSEVAAAGRALLRTQGLAKAFNGFHAVAGVDLTVREGTVHAIIGPNGAGKTSCFNLIAGTFLPSAGRIFFNDVDITSEHAERVAQRGIGRSFQISSVFPSLTCLENVRLALQRRRGGSFDFWRSKQTLHRYDAEAMALLEEVGLGSSADMVAGLLPYGNKRALEIATTLALGPKLLLLDEPTAGMGQESIERLMAIVRRARIGHTILMVEHNLSVVEGLCDIVTVMARGRIIAEGAYSQVAENPEVRAAYLGMEDEELPEERRDPEERPF